MSRLTGWIVVIYAIACALTGLGPVLHYVPEPGSAHASVVALQGATVFGHALRSAHALSAHLCLGAIVLHVVAVLATKRERLEEPRHWLSGVVAAILLVALAFGGRVLPWDQHAGVSWTVSVSMIPGLEPWLNPSDSGTLARMLVLHLGGALLMLGVTAGHGYNPETLRTMRENPAMVARVSAAALAPLAMAAAFVRMPLGPAFEPGVDTGRITSEWYVRWIEVIAVRSGWLAQAAAAVVLAAAIATPWWARRMGEARARQAWWLALVALGILSLVPVR